MLTRMRHITMQFDVKEWAKWADQKGIDPRGIQFVLSHEKLIRGNRTTPRTLVHFFESIEKIQDLKKNKKLVQLLCEASLDEEAVAAFLNFIDQNADDLPSPQTILGTEDFQNEVYLPLYKIIVGEQIRSDILSAVNARLLNQMEQSKQVSEKEIQNYTAFLKMDFFPADLRFSIAQDLTSSSNNQLKSLLSDPELSKLLLTV